MLAHRDEATVPEATVRQWESCTNEAAGRLSASSYAIQFDVNVTEQGEVTEAKIADSMLGDEQIEACMLHALETMSLPTSALPIRSSRPISGGEWLPESRKHSGHAAAAGGAAAVLGPVVLVMAGAYILAQVSVRVVAPAIDAAIRRRKAAANCNAKYQDCINYGPTSCLKQEGGKTQCNRCLERCNAGEPPSATCVTCKF
jgi:hypothetical protein